jgi:flavin-dependent dehydrogenase
MRWLARHAEEQGVDIFPGFAGARGEDTYDRSTGGSCGLQVNCTQCCFEVPAAM